MAITRPTSEQLRFVSQFTGEHVLDTYLESAEKGGRSLTDLLDDLFASDGTFRSANFEFRFDPTTDKIQFRAGNFASATAGYTDVTTFFKITGTYSSSTTYNNFDLLTLANKDVYIVHGLSAGTTFANEAAVIASANTDKLVDVSEARDWAKKTDGIVDSTDYSSKAWAIGGTGVTDTASKGAAKEWAIKTSGTVDGTNYSAKYWATSTDVTTVAGIAANITTVAGISSNVTAVAAKASLITSDFVSDLNTLAVTDVINDINLLATSDIVSDLNTIATSDIVADLNTLATSDIVSDINTLATSDIVTDLNALATSDFVSDLNAMATSGNISALNTVSGAIANVNTVSTNIANVNTTGGAIANVNAVGGDIANVNSLAGVLTGSTTYVVTVANVGGTNVFVLDGVNTPVLSLQRGNTYVFNQADNTNSGHPLAFKDASGSSYTTGVTVSGSAGSSGATVTFVLASNAPASLRYYCTVHGNAMGNTITTSTSTLNVVAGSIANVNLTGSSIANVNLVGGSIANVNTVSGVTANLATVAGISANVTTVAGVAANVTTVAGIASDVTLAAANTTAFNNLYLGAQSSAPTADPDGSALDLGDLYFDTGADVLKVRAAGGWINAGSAVNGTSARFAYTATGGQTNFSGNDANGNSLLYDSGFCDIYLNGAKLAAGDFTASSGTSVVLTSGATVDDILEIVAFGTFTLSNQTFSGTTGVSNLTATGNITVTGTVDGQDVAAMGTKLAGIETAATADQTKSDIEGLGIDVPAPNLTGTIAAARLSTATTQAESDDSTKIATTAYVVDKITTLIGGAPNTLNDLNELAAAINDDAAYNSTLTTALATKLPKAGGALTGNLSTTGQIDINTANSGLPTLKFSHTNAGADNFQIGGGIPGTSNGGFSIRDVDASANRFVINSSGDIGIGTAAPDGTLHVHTASAGTVAASSQADDLVVESNTEAGITILSPDNQSARIRFSSPSTNTDVGGAFIFYRQNINKMQLGTSVSGGVLSLVSGAANETMVLDGSGNVGIGVVPETWGSFYDVLQISSGGSLAGSTSNRSRVFLNANTYINASNQQSYIATDEASQYWQNGGTHIFNVAASGSADSAISWNTAMTINNSGNVGIGQVPATDWSASYDALQVGAQGVMFAHTSGGGDASTWITNNAYVSTGGWKALSTNEASHYQQKNGEHNWSNAPSVSAGAGLTFTNRMKIDSSGNVGIGTDTNNDSTGSTTILQLQKTLNDSDLALRIQNNATGASTTGSIRFNNTTSTYDHATIKAGRNPSSLQILTTNNTLDNVLFNDSGTTFNGQGSSILDFRVKSNSNASAFFVDAGAGFVAINTDNNSTTTNVGHKWHMSANQTTQYIVTNVNVGTYYPLGLYNAHGTFNGSRFRTHINGGVANFSANNVNLSDQRMKENITLLADGALAKICAIPVKTFNYKDEPDGTDVNIGVIAQDVEAVAPELVDHEWGRDNDGVMADPFGDGVPLKSVFSDDIQYTMMKAIQELKTALDVATARITALEDN